jgi:hypothetical protein
MRDFVVLFAGKSRHGHSPPVPQTCHIITLTCHITTLIKKSGALAKKNQKLPVVRPVVSDGLSFSLIELGQTFYLSAGS